MFLFLIKTKLIKYTLKGIWVSSTGKNNLRSKNNEAFGYQVLP